MTFEQKYSRISKKLFGADISKLSMDFAIQITMDDEDCGGTFFVANINGAYSVQPYDYVDNTATLNIMSADLNKLIDKKVSVADLLSDGLVKVSGDVDAVISLFDAFEKKTTVRKTTTKKETTKKAPAKKVAKAEVEAPVKKVVKEEVKTPVKKETKAKKTAAKKDK